MNKNGCGYKIWRRETTVRVLNVSKYMKSLHTLTAEARLAEGQLFNCMPEIERRNVSEKQRSDLKTSSIQRGRIAFKIKVGLGKQRCVKVMRACA
jgi:predicted HTH domain antitoxin